MEKTTMKKVPLKVQELKKLRQVLSNELGKSMDIQIFLEKSLYDEIKYNYFDFHMEPGECDSKGHYANYVENSFEFQNAKGHYEGTIEFVANCTGFMQVSHFKSDFFDYIHYNCGMKKVLIVCKSEDEK